MLALVWGGGWWLFVLLALAALIGLHEYYMLIRSLHPLVLAGYAGVVLALLGAELGGLPWAIGGLYATILFAFAQYGIATTRQPATIAIGSTLLGVAWIGGGLASFELIRAIPERGHHLGQLAAFTVLLAVFAADSVAYGMGRLVGHHKLSPVLSPGKTWEGFFAGVAEGRVADVVDQGQCLGQLGVQPQGHGQGARDLGDLQGVGEAAAEVVRQGVRGQAGEDLGLAGQAAKGARVQNARGVAGESSAVGMRGLEVRAAGQIAVCVSANSNPWG